MSEEELIERLKELKEEGAILGEDEVKILLNLIEKQYRKIEKVGDYIQQEIWLCEHDIEACTGNDENARKIFVDRKEIYEKIQDKLLGD
jgi:DNA-binding Lrp family transcriptional regulator